MVTFVLVSTKVGGAGGNLTPTGHQRYLSSITEAAMGSLWTV